MKKVIMLSMILVLITLAGCKKDNDKPDEEPKPTTKEMLLGKWQLNKLVDETRTLDGVLVDTETEMGEPGDSIIFKDNNQVYNYEDMPGGIVDEDIYPLMLHADSLISWDQGLYIIKKLTNTELYLYQVDPNPQNNQIEVVNMYLVR
jgi:hypothetical protein